MGGTADGVDKRPQRGGKRPNSWAVAGKKSDGPSDVPPAQGRGDEREETEANEDILNEMLLRRPVEVVGQVVGIKGSEKIWELGAVRLFLFFFPLLAWWLPAGSCRRQGDSA
jgi:hypothetical protein